MLQHGLPPGGIEPAAGKLSLGNRLEQCPSRLGPADQPLEHIELPITGMTCASCVARIERKLNKLDGVEASVNYATERATVHCDPSVTVDDLVSAVEAAGYRAHPVEDAGVHHHHDEPIGVLRRRLVVAIALTAPLAVLAMIPALQFSGWEWVAFALATPVVLWSGIGFHRVALITELEQGS